MSDFKKSRKKWLWPKKVDSFYQVSPKTYLILFAKGIAQVILFSYLFYENISMILLVSPYLMFYVKKEEKREKEKQKKELELQFKEALVGITNALNAGYSIENSITQTINSLQCIYSEDSMIIKQFKQMELQLSMNETIESVFEKFAKRAQIEEIYNFSWILITAKRTGGDLLRIVRNTTSLIRQKIEVEREIRTILAAKQYEANLMNFIPLAILMYLKICSPHFLDPLYHNIAGFTVMTIVLVLYLATLQLSKWIGRIRY